MKVRKKSLKERALGKFKNNASSIATTAVMVAGISLFLFAKECDTTRPIVEPIRGDGVCMEVEAYECNFNPNGTQKRSEDGKCLEFNPYFSFEDCHRGNDQCDDQSERAKLRDREGRPVPDLMSHYVKRAEDGSWAPDQERPIKLPLEDENSPDCQIQKVADHPCAERAEDGSNEILKTSRIRMTGDTAIQFERWRTSSEIEQMHANPATVSLDDNDYRIDVNYDEAVCAVSETHPLCTPESLVPCACPNLEACAPPPPQNCGNGSWDKAAGEQCDRSSKAGRVACGTSKVCTRSCRCVIKSAPPPVAVDDPVVCGNGRIQPGEECDPTATPSGCGTGERCTTSCECEDVQPTKVTSCPGNRVPGMGTLVQRITSTITGNGGQLRSALGVSSVAIDVSVSVSVDTSGVPTLLGANASCGGQGCPSSANVIQVTGLNLSGVTTGAPNETCVITVPVRVRPPVGG